MSHRATSSLIAFTAILALVAGCGPAEEGPNGDAAAPAQEVDEVETAPSPTAPPAADDEPTEAEESLPEGVTERPEWLGTRVLPERPDGLGEVQPTPPELEDRRFPPPDDHPLPPPEDDGFSATIDPIPDDVLERSTWHPDCPVAVDELRYLTLTYWGFDERNHTGEMIVHAGVAEDVVEVFARIHEARFPIEEMRVVAAEELDLPPTGDGNNSTGFVCRSTVSGGSWSEHAYGRAIDINPFHNPYERRDVVVPELASAYTHRDWVRPGMILDGDEVVEAFAAIGWSWGGDWTTATDPMHFSVSGR